MDSHGQGRLFKMILRSGHERAMTKKSLSTLPFTGTSWVEGKQARTLLGKYPLAMSHVAQTSDS